MSRRGRPVQCRRGRFRGRGRWPIYPDVAEVLLRWVSGGRGEGKGRGGITYADPNSEFAHVFWCTAHHFDPILSFHAVGPGVRIVGRARRRLQRMGFEILGHAGPGARHVVHPNEGAESQTGIQRVGMSATTECGLLRVSCS